MVLVEGRPGLATTLGTQAIGEHDGRAGTLFRGDSCTSTNAPTSSIRADIPRPLVGDRISEGCKGSPADEPVRGAGSTSLNVDNVEKSSGIDRSVDILTDEIKKHVQSSL